MHTDHLEVDDSSAPRSSRCRAKSVERAQDIRVHKLRRCATETVSRLLRAGGHADCSRYATGMCEAGLGVWSFGAVN